MAVVIKLRYLLLLKSNFFAGPETLRAANEINEQQAKGLVRMEGELALTKESNSTIQVLSEIQDIINNIKHRLHIGGFGKSMERACRHT